MARATKSNGFGRDHGFLSDIVSGEVTVENPDGVLMSSTDMGPYSTSLRLRKYPLQTSGTERGDGKDNGSS